MKRVVAIVAGLAASFASPAAAENWRVFEGNNGSTKGSWSLTTANGAITGHAHMVTIINQNVDYAVVGTTDGENFNLRRMGASDGKACAYNGRVSLDRKQIQGAAHCDDGDWPWIAHFAPSAPPAAGAN